MSTGAAEGDQRSLRERLICAAIRFTAEHGWSALTMAKLAHRVGVSRQTVYNELGTKPQLAEAMVMTELARFLGVVDDAFVRHAGDLVAAVREAARSVLVLAEDSPLLRAVLASRQGAESDLLPLLTTHSAPLLDSARDMIRAHVAAFDLGLEPERLESLIDMVVRLVLSHVMQPGGRPEETADSIAWIAGRVVDAVPAVRG
ncbi:MAG: TetR family transcriptional regulator [Marmoricola sp.]